MSVAEIINQARKLPEDDFLALVREMELAAAEVVDDRFEKAVLEGKFDHLADGRGSKIKKVKP